LFGRAKFQNAHSGHVREVVNGIQCARRVHVEASELGFEVVLRLAWYPVQLPIGRPFSGGAPDSARREVRSV